MSKRENYISWDEYFMGIALLSAQRSKDPNTQVGACIVNSDNKVVGIGYNGLPNKCSDDEFPWDRTGEFLETKYAYVCHAELNAIANKTCDLKGCTIYTTLFPCNECAKLIIQNGICKIIYLEDKYKELDSTIAAKRMFDSADFVYEEFESNRDFLNIYFKHTFKQVWNVDCLFPERILK